MEVVVLTKLPQAHFHCQCIDVNILTIFQQLEHTQVGIEVQKSFRKVKLKISQLTLARLALLEIIANSEWWHGLEFDYNQEALFVPFSDDFLWCPLVKLKVKLRISLLTLARLAQSNSIVAFTSTTGST